MTKPKGPSFRANFATMHRCTHASNQQRPRRFDTGAKRWRWATLGRDPYTHEAVTTRLPPRGQRSDDVARYAGVIETNDECC